jgi:hypothetical protein
LAAALLIAARAPVLAATPTEHDLRAAYIFNILRLSERQAIAQPSPFLTLGIYAAGALDSPLRSLEGSVVRGRKFRIREIQQESELRGCDAVFLGRWRGGGAKILSAADMLGLLTMGDDSDFIPAGGMVALLVESRRIVVEINTEAIAGAGWSLSSHLLEVARLVKRRAQ